jgi:protein-disulfide isomerase
MKADRPLWHRRVLLAGGGIALVGWVKGAPYLASFGTPELAFQTLPDLAPFRRLANAGATSGGAGGAIFAGLETREPLSAEQLRLDLAVKSDPCAAFYGSMRDGPVPVAMFSDFACPICRIMESRIAELEASDPGSFRVVRHQLPILGTASTMASRAVLAADRQGAYREMHERLIRTPAVTDISYVTAIAANIGLDPDQFRADLNSGEIDQTLRLTEAIARVFGFYGTPAFAVGQTVFLGAIPKSTLQALIDYEVGNACQTS